jgi:hypothetical protein
LQKCFFTINSLVSLSVPLAENRLKSRLLTSLSRREEKRAVIGLTGFPDNDLHLNGVSTLSKPAPSKLFKLKQWLTLPEAAKHLSGVCGEEVTEADILRLALERHLKISVNLVNRAHVKPGKVIHFDDEKLISLLEQGIYPDELTWTVSLFSDEPRLLNLKIAKGKYLKTEDTVGIIEGVWDLPMIGGERIYVERLYHLLTGGP